MRDAENPAAGVQDAGQAKRTLMQLPGADDLLTRPGRILLIEDDPDHADAVHALLGGGWVTTWHSGRRCTTSRASRRRRTGSCAAATTSLLVDWNLKGRDGLLWLREARARGLATPALMLTTVDRVEQALSEGADDFLAKSAMARELRPRVLARLRRDRLRIDYGPLRVDFAANAVLMLDAGVPMGVHRRVPLQPVELLLLGALVRDDVLTAADADPAGVSVARLLTDVWQQNLLRWADGVERVHAPKSSNVIEKSVSTLRSRLNAAGAPGVVERIAAAMSLEDAATLLLSDEDRALARSLTLNYRFAAGEILKTLAMRPVA